MVSVDPERTWFRYHRLLGDFLRLELRRTRPEEVPVLHRRAAGWFAEHGQVVDSIRHTQAAGDWSEAARLLADHSFSLTLDGLAQTIQALVRAWERADTATALDLHLRNLELFEGLFATASPILLKACMNLLGLPAGPLRPPLVDATGDQVEFARGLLAGVGLDPRD